MKRSFLLLASLLFCVSALSQEYAPRVTWPFLYEEFMPGAIRTLDGAFVNQADFNVTASDGTLVYIGTDNIIMKPNMLRVYAAKVGDDVYANIGGRMYKLLSELDCGMVVLGKEVDIDAMNKSDIGYGKSSVASTQNLSLIAIGAGNLASKSLDSLTPDKYTGKELVIKDTYYLYFHKQLIRANRGDILKLEGVDPKAAKDFFKQEKIKWRDVASLEKVLIFLNSQIK